MASDIRLVLTDPSPLFRAALAHLLAAQAGLSVVGEAASGSEAVTLVLERSPDVLLLDLDLPGREGVETVRRVQDLQPRTEVVVLTGQHNEALQRQAFEAGVRGYLFKDCAPSTLVEAIRAARLGDFYLADGAGRDLVAEYARPHAGSQSPGGWITPRERELACLLADGYSSKEAAAVLNISIKTVETHRAALMRKLGARNVVDIVKYCIRNRLIEV